jgi:hypothetical protein
MQIGASRDCVDGSEVGKLLLCCEDYGCCRGGGGNAVGSIFG